MSGERSGVTETSDAVSRAKHTLTQVPARYYVGLLLLAGLAVLPNYIGVLDTVKMQVAFFLVIFAISWDFVSAYTGQVSFGHTLFFATGGYTTTILHLEYGVDPIVGIVVAVLLAGGAGVLLGIPALRIEGHYLALFTLLPPLIMLRLFKVFSDTFGGSKGLPKPANLVEMDGFIATAEANYWVAYASFLLVFGIAWVITRTDVGIVFTAIRENEEAVQAAGINPNKFKLYAFTVSAMMGGFGGAVLVHTPAGSASPSQLLTLTIMIEVLIASILGGFGTITGPAVGGFFLYWALDWFSNVGWTIPVIDVAVSRLDELLFYVLILLLLLFLAEGIVPWMVRLGRRVLPYVTGSSSVATDGGRTPRTLVTYRDRLYDMIDRFVTKRRDR